MKQTGITIWRSAPFLRCLPGFMTGILFQWYVQPGEQSTWILLILSTAGLLSFSALPLSNRYSLSWLPGILIFLCLGSSGALLTRYQDIRNQHQWLGHLYRQGDALITTIEEPLVSKEKTFKAEASASRLLRAENSWPLRGRLIIYFLKDSSVGSDALPDSTGYGSQIIFRKKPEPIRRSGNPGAFDYQAYCLFKGITHQVFLRPGEYEQLPGKNTDPLKNLIFKTREKVLTLLRTNIPGKKERGLAEALLIGYRNDLDQELVQSYSNTGVVHIIAISGLHLGLIYWLLDALLRPLRRKRNMKWMRPLLIIAGLWGFTLLAGAQPSVLRSALMFSLLVLGEAMNRKSAVFNSLALSAFLLLCINPFWLWDTGFQLSYAAVASILVFGKPVYNLLYCSRKLPNQVWKLNAVTLAAQVLTLPLCIYRFHQFPMTFLLTNLVAVPLSGILLLAEILLCLLSFIPLLAGFLGQCISGGIWLMNFLVEQAERIPGARWEGLQISLWQLLLLYLATWAGSDWLLNRRMRGCRRCLTALLAFFILRTNSFFRHSRQQMIIVYNIPKQSALEFITGRDYFLIGDSSLRVNGPARNFDLNPAHLRYRTSQVAQLGGLTRNGNYIGFHGKHILLVNKSLSFAPAETKQRIDLLLISQNPVLSLSRLAAALDIRQVVIDGSVPPWIRNAWKKNCDSLGLPCHDVSSGGAFVMTLN